MCPFLVLPKAPFFPDFLSLFIQFLYVEFSSFHLFTYESTFYKIQVKHSLIYKTFLDPLS